VRKKILSISGHRHMNYLLKTTFSNNYSVIPANNISDGITKLKTTKNIDLFIIDADFETQESIDFMKFVSNSSLYSKPVIVLLSDQKIVDRFGNEITPHYFVKPFDPVKLITAANEILRQVLTMQSK
jgi:DNA-binding response OmpR family regulator